MAVPAHDLEAERAVIGAMVYWPETIEPLLGMVEASDFHDPTDADAFTFIEEQHWQGKPVNEAILVSHLKALGRQVTNEWRADLVELGNSTAYVAHAETVTRHAARRDLQLLLDDARSQNADPAVHPGDIVQSLQGRLERVDLPTAQLPDDCLPLGEFVAQDDEKLDPWVVPGLMRRGWRLIMVAGEGAGKSILFRQFAVCCAAGKHPLNLMAMEPIRVLLVDLENPPGTTVRSLRRMAQYVPDLDRDRVMVWSRPGGMDILQRTDRRQLESVILHHRPSLVMIGPLYKTYEEQGRKSEEHDAKAAQRVFDRLRTRYGFALMIEHHAPHGQGADRDMRPIGSSAWRRWPELGFGLKRETKNAWHPLLVGRWRTDRDENAWPDKLDKGDTVPWVGVWPDDSWQQAF